MQPRIETLSPKKLIGFSVEMSLVDNKTGQLWGKFMPRRKEVMNAVSDDKFSLQIYDENYYSEFSPQRVFTKWATVEVSDFQNIPEGMQTLELTGGLYAVFDYKGSSAEAPKFFQYILGEWLPKSGFTLDNRPHFEVLGEKYKNNDPNSEEEIWIPVREV